MEDLLESLYQLLERVNDVIVCLQGDDAVKIPAKVYLPLFRDAADLANEIILAKKGLDYDNFGEEDIVDLIKKVERLEEGLKEALK